MTLALGYLNNGDAVGFVLGSHEHCDPNGRCSARPLGLLFSTRTRRQVTTGPHIFFAAMGTSMAVDCCISPQRPYTSS